MKSLTQKYKIKAPAASVWQALVDPEVINKWGGGPSEMDEKVGFNFKLWGGDIWGKNIKVIKNKLLIQDWYSGNWDKPSEVKLSLTQERNTTILTLEHTKIPDNEFRDIKSGWDDYYLGPLKELLEK